VDGKTRLGLGVLGGALALGLLGDWLLRATPWGINFFLWVGALVGAAVVAIRRGHLQVTGEGRWLVPVAMLFAVCVAWRDSAALAALNLLAFVVAASLALLRARTGRLRLAGVSEYVLGGLYAGALSSAGPVPVVAREVEWQRVARGRWRAPALAVARGVLLAAPLLLLFGALFAAADAVFQSLLSDFFGFDVAEALGHLFLTLALAWISAGALWVSLLAQGRDNLAVRRPDFLSIGIGEVGTVLGLLDLLFLGFVAVQVRYLFGGADRVVSTAGLTYAEYARRGFFELVTVTALALPALLLAHWLLRAGDRERVFRVLAGALVALLFVIMASAMQRMYLYVGEYGLTQLRLYVTAFMVWLAVVLAWFILTVLRGRRDRFAFGALLAAFAAVLTLNAINPDALIARTNLDRMQDGKRFDPYYLTTLSADAAPVLLDAFPETELALEEEILENFREEEGSWRTWNLGRSRARHLAYSYVATRGPKADTMAGHLRKVNST
jgi:Domain of unknown function (DUF4173)